jgi:hypothetical protein
MTLPNTTPPDRDGRLPGRWGVKRILLIVGAIFILLLAINLLSRVHGDPGEKARLEPETRMETPAIINDQPSQGVSR